MEQKSFHIKYATYCNKEDVVHLLLISWVALSYILFFSVKSKDKNVLKSNIHDVFSNIPTYNYRGSNNRLPAQRMLII